MSIINKFKTKVPDQLKECKIIPLKNNTKVCYEQWNTNDELEFDGTETGYGIDTGRSNLVVIDCDNKHNNPEDNGIITFIKIANEHNDKLETLTVETPNNGVHFYYQLPAGVKIKSSVNRPIGKEIDVRSDGGYIVGPGSIIETKDKTLKEYELENEDSVIQMIPDWLLTILTKPEKENKEIKPSVKEDKNKDTLSMNEEIEQRNTFDWAVHKMNTAVEGERNSVLNHISYFMGCKRIPLFKAKEIIGIAISRGLSEKEVETTFNKAYNDGLKEEVPLLNSIIKEFNTKTNVSFKEDPLDTEFYSHFSLSYNYWLKNRDNLLWWSSDESWYEYNDQIGIWKETKEEKIKVSISNFFEKLVVQIRKDNPKLPISIYKAQEKLWSRNTVDSVLSMSKGIFMNDDPQLFDKYDYLVNCKNGVFDLRTEKLSPHDKKYYMRNIISLNLDLEAQDNFCDMVLDSIYPDEKNYLQLMAGQSLTGQQNKTQVAIFLFGRGSNGKSTFVDLMLKTSGSYGKLQTPSVLLADNGRENYAMADFEGLRTAIIEELPDSKHLNSGALKRLVGTQKINSRKIYSSHREFENQSTIFVSCNRLPVVTETDEGTWRRLIVVSFPYSYKKNKEDVKSEFDRLGNPQVLYAAQKKTKTAEAFLAWRIKGAIEWFKNERAEYSIPESINNTVINWNENNDLMFAWFNESVEFDPTSYITALDLLESFNDWLINRGNAKVSMRYFSDALQNHKVFLMNKLVYKKKGFIKKELKRSPYTKNNQYIENNSARPTFVEGISFK